MNTQSLRKRSAALLPTMVVTACIVTGDAGELTAGQPGTSGSTMPATTVGDTAGSDRDKLDLASPDVPSMECASVSQTTTIEERPSDILVVVDRVMEPVSTDATFLNFSQLIDNDGIEDVQVVMLAGYPPDGVCIDEPPLGIGQCPTDDNNPPMYRHFDVVIEGQTLLSQIVAEQAQWSGLLRPSARTHVFVVTSQDATMTAEDFDAAFKAMDPPLSAYTFHAIAPAGPIDTGDCGGVTPGAGWALAPKYEALCTATGGVFEDACNYNVDVLFERLLSRVQQVALACEYDIPPPPEGLVFDKGKVNVEYDDGSGLQTVGYVEDAADCPSVSDGWYYDDNITPQRILMCPQTCAGFDALPEASIEIRFGCTTIPAG